MAFADKADDWDATNYLTLTGNGNTFSQDSSGTYILDLKGAFAQFSYVEGQWQIVNFGRLSDAYGIDYDNIMQKTGSIMTGALEANAGLSATTINFTLPTSTAGLSAGDVWNDNGVVSIV